MGHHNKTKKGNSVKVWKPNHCLLNRKLDHKTEKQVKSCWNHKTENWPVSLLLIKDRVKLGLENVSHEMRIKAVWKKRKDVSLCTNNLKRIKDPQKPSLETAMQYCKTKLNISQCSQNYLEAPLQDSFIIAGLSSTPTKLEHWSHIDDKISFFQHAHLLEARLTTLLNQSRASLSHSWQVNRSMGPQLLSRKVRGWSIFRCISSSRLKTYIHC